MQRTRAIPVAWLSSGLCPDGPKGWIPIIIICKIRFFFYYFIFILVHLFPVYYSSYYYKSLHETFNYLKNRSSCAVLCSWVSRHYRKRSCYSYSKTVCRTRYRTRLAGRLLLHVATIRHTTDTFLSISHTTNILLFKFCCNIFIGVRIIKEMPGSAASGTHSFSSSVFTMECSWAGSYDYFSLQIIQDLNFVFNDARRRHANTQLSHATLGTLPFIILSTYCVQFQLSDFVMYAVII